ncbi:MAG TPA: AraC family transcriptional regulator [Candidatus Blautia faecipullorum]|nr:AraC family transcriptional regulator [Candidatus Blautia faecipullorum]
MIHNLDGIYETVDYRTDTQICLYHNDEYENYPPHWHTSFEIIMPLINSYRVLCGDKEYLLREGDILIICPCMIHELFAPETGERIIFQPGTNWRGIKELNLLISILSPSHLVTPENYPQVYGQIHKLMLDIHEEYFSLNSYVESAVFSKFLELLVCVGRNHKKLSLQNVSHIPTRQREYVEKFLFITNYIDDHFTEALTLEEVASLAGFSKYHFSRLFKQYTDFSFYKYLNQKRIEHSKVLLLDPKLTVIEIALQSGFSSLSAFLRMFKQTNKCTPTEFRNMYTGH